MNINIRLQDLKKMRDYLNSEQQADLLSIIIDYAEEGQDWVIEDEKMSLIWMDIKPYLDKSRENYQKWLKEQKKQKETEKPHYVGRVSDYYDELIKKGDDKE